MHFSHACYIRRPSCLPWFNHPSHTCRNLQVMKHVTMQPSATSCKFLTFRFKYFLTSLFSDTLNYKAFIYEGASKSFRNESITKYTLRTINTRWEATQRVMAAKHTRLTHEMAINGRQIYHLQFSLQAASPETFGYTLVEREAQTAGVMCEWSSGL
jgi:hypothetical protein